jgi:hypothetical protein
VSLLFDLLAEVVSNSGVGPSSSRALMVLGSVTGTTLSCAIVWLLVISPDPLQEPEWGLGAIALGFVFTLPAILVSVIVLRRENEVLPATLTLLVNLCALALAISAVV